MTARLTDKVVPKRKWPRIDLTVERKEIRIVLDPDSPSQLPGSTFFTARGDPVPGGEVLKRLKKGGPILLSITGKKVDPYYLQVVQPKTLVFVLGPRDGAPDLDLLPRVAPSRKNR